MLRFGLMQVQRRISRFLFVSFSLFPPSTYDVLFRFRPQFRLVVYFFALSVLCRLLPACLYIVFIQSFPGSLQKEEESNVVHFVFFLGCFKSRPYLHSLVYLIKCIFLIFDFNVSSYCFFLSSLSKEFHQFTLY